MQKLKLKSKIVFVFIVFVAAIISFGLYTSKTEVKFNKYADVEILTNQLNLGEFKNGDMVDTCFIIMNKSINPFVITEINASKDVKFFKTRINKLIEYNKKTKIYFQFRANENGLIKKEIEVISNSKKGKIILKFNYTIK